MMPNIADHNIGNHIGSQRTTGTGGAVSNTTIADAIWLISLYVDYTPFLKKNCAKLFLPKLRQISTYFDNFWHRDSKNDTFM